MDEEDEKENFFVILFYTFNVYYESKKRELQTKLIYECRCDERLKTKVEESTRLACTVLHDKTNFLSFFVVYYESIKRDFFV